MTSVSNKFVSLHTQINYEDVITSRKQNFSFLHQQLKYLNQLHFDVGSDSVPFCYPFLPASEVDKNILHNYRFYIPSFWEDTSKRGIKGFENEKMLSRYLLPLPIDHRYNIQDMEIMASFIKNLTDGK